MCPSGSVDAYDIAEGLGVSVAAILETAVTAASCTVVSAEAAAPAWRPCAPDSANAAFGVLSDGPP